MNKHTIVATSITEYCAFHSTDEPKIAKEIFTSSQKHPKSYMLVGKIVGNLLGILATYSKSKKILEIGTFTGYSAAMLASGLSKGTLVTLEESAENFKLASKNLRQFIGEGLIEVVNSEGLDWLGKYQGDAFDIIFLDARKESYVRGMHIELLYKNMSIHGLLIVDNSLAKGSVLNPEKEWQKLTQTFNKVIASDCRFRTVLLPIRDGILIAQKLK